MHIGNISFMTEASKERRLIPCESICIGLRKVYGRDINAIWLS